jgi:hypothetical protein
MSPRHELPRSRAGLAAITVVAAGLCFTNAQAQEDESVSFEGLKRVENARVAAAYIDPEADFSVFKRVAILEPLVAFRSNWQRDANRSRRGSSRISTADMDRIKADLGALLTEVFTERLEADNGYEVVDVAGPDVLLLRPAIIDLEVNAPDTQTSGRSQSYTTSAGYATLYLEAFDSMTGDILGRAIDRREARRAGTVATWSNRVTNTQDARRLLGRWADLLRDFLDEHYLEANTGSAQ